MLPQPIPILRLQADAEFSGATQDLLTALAGQIEVVRTARLAEADIEDSAHPFQAILVEMGGTGSAGVELLSRLRAAAGPLPLVIVGGRDDPASLREVWEGEPPEFIEEEELSGALLLRTIRYALERADSEKMQKQVIEMKAALAEADAASRSMSAFLAKMSHEIRTPMNGVIGMTELLLDTPLTPMQRDYVNAISTSGDVLLRLIDDVLDLSKVEAGKLALEQVPFDLEDLAHEAAELFAAKAEAKGVQIICGFQPRIPTRAVGDPHRLRQIIANLLSNAVKFTQEGEIILQLGLKEDRGDTAVFEIAVEDSGVGIDEEAQSRLFKAFSQASDTTSRTYGGTGLGLAIARQLVQMMGGTIRVESEPGRGSLFRFDVLLQKAEPVRAVGADTALLLHGKRVLIADRSSSVRTHLAKYLRAWGAEVCEEASGVPTLQRIECGDLPDIILLEQDLTDVPGLALAAAIRGADAAGKSKIVVLAGFSQSYLKEKADAAGLAGCVAKPIRPRELLSVLWPTSSPVHPEGASGDGGENAPAIELQRARGRILLAEDNPINQRVAQLLLERIGFEVDIASTGAEAVQAAENRLYDAILMDIQMPGGTGHEATKEIRRLGGRIAATPIIAVSANVMNGAREDCLAVGMDDFLAKPLRVAQLQEVLSRWLADDKLDAGREGASFSPPADSLPGTVLETLAQLQNDLSPHELEDLVGQYCTNLPEILDRLREAAEAANTEQLEFLAHQLKGSASVFGARRLVLAAMHLERLAADAELGQVRDLVQLLTSEGLRLREGLKAAVLRPATTV